MRVMSQGISGKNWENFYKITVLPVRQLVLFEGGLRLNMYIVNFRPTSKKIKNKVQRILCVILKGELKWNYMKCAIKTRKKGKISKKYNE